GDGHRIDGFGQPRPGSGERRRRREPYRPGPLRNVIVAAVERVPAVADPVRIERRDRLLPLPGLRVLIGLQQDFHVGIRTADAVFPADDRLRPPDPAVVIAAFELTLLLVAGPVR